MSKPGSVCIFLLLTTDYVLLVPAAKVEEEPLRFGRGHVKAGVCLDCRQAERIPTIPVVVRPRSPLEGCVEHS